MFPQFYTSPSFSADSAVHRRAAGEVGARRPEIRMNAEPASAKGGTWANKRREGGLIVSVTAQP